MAKRFSSKKILLAVANRQNQALEIIFTNRCPVGAAVCYNIRGGVAEPGPTRLSATQDLVSSNLTTASTRLSNGPTNCRAMFARFLFCYTIRMSWAAKRRFFILLIVGAVAVAFMTTVGIAAFYDAPSCTDGVQNQNEAGVDCGGACQYLCTADMQPPTVLFTKVLGFGTGRTDVVASIENKNIAAAAKSVPYTITLYGPDQSIIQRVRGNIDLPPGASVPVFVPGIISGQQKVAKAFLDIVSSAPRWFVMRADARVVPIVASITKGGTVSNPRIEAVLTNPSIITLTNLSAIVLVRDVKGEIIAVSSTLVPSIYSQSQATATFTWNDAFPGIPASLEVVPIVPLK